MDNRKLRVILFVVTALFLVGVTWAIIVIARRNNNVTVETPTTPNEQSDTPSPQAGETPTDAPAESQPISPESSGITSQPSKKKRLIVAEETTFEVSAEASAWASAGVNPDGSTYAEAHAE